MKIIKPKEIIYACDICGRRFGKGARSGMKKYLRQKVNGE